MEKVLFHTVLSVTLEIKVQGYSTNQVWCVILKKQQQNSSAHLQMSQLGKQSSNYRRTIYTARTLKKE